MAVCSRINLASHAGYKNGHRRFGASLIDAYICIMVWIHYTVGSAAWKDVATIGHWKRAPPRIVVLFVVQIPEGPLPMACPRGAKGGCDRPVLARLIMLLRSRYRAVRIAQLSVAAGRDQRNTRAVRDGRNEGRSLPSALVACQDGSRGVSTSYLVTLLSARKKEMFVAKFVLDIKVPMEVDAASVA